MFKKAQVNGVNVEYAVSDEIENNHRRYDHHDERVAHLMEQMPQEGELIAQLIRKPERKLDRMTDCYPNNDTYQFQEFAGFVFELGGYCDISMIDPYTRKRLWVGNALGDISKPMMEREPVSIWNAMRKVIDVAEALGFPACEATDND